MASTWTGESEEDDSERTASGESSQEKLECAVCLQTCVQPVQLPCKHIFCYLCVKGVTHQSKRCAMCRQEIPANYLDNPHLISYKPSNLAFEGSYQWFYEGKNGWWQYDERTSTEIEAAFKAEEKQCEVLIAGFLYVIDFENNVQYRRCDPSRRRKIKRDLISAPKKGVAGIRTPSSQTEESLPPVEQLQLSDVSCCGQATKDSPTSGLADSSVGDHVNDVKHDAAKPKPASTLTCGGKIIDPSAYAAVQVMLFGGACVTLLLPRSGTHPHQNSSASSNLSSTNENSEAVGGNQGLQPNSVPSSSGAQPQVTVNVNVNTQCKRKRGNRGTSAVNPNVTTNDQQAEDTGNKRAKKKAEGKEAT